MIPLCPFHTDDDTPNLSPEFVLVPSAAEFGCLSLDVELEGLLFQNNENCLEVLWRLSVIVIIHIDLYTTKLLGCSLQSG